MPTIKELTVAITANVSGLLNGTKTATETLTKLGTSVNASMKKMEELGEASKALGGTMSKFGTAMSVGITLPLVAAGAAAVQSAASMEMLNAEFTTLLGDGDKAAAMLESLAKAAAKTPFALEDLSQASKTMLAFGLSADEVLPNLQMLGDVAGGNSEKLKSLTLAFSQIQSTGKLMGQDLLQLINAGFNPLQTISEKTGETMAELKKRMEQGAVSAGEVSDAFKTATSEGGLFFGGMERASQTFSGRLSTLKDDMTAVARQFGEVMLPALSDMLNVVSGIVQSFSNFDDATKETIIKVGLMVAAIGPLIAGFGKLLVLIPELVTAIKLLTGPQVMGALISGGPIILGLTAVAATIAAITVNTIAAKNEQERYNNAIAGQLTLQETQRSLEEKLKRVQEERQNLARLEAQGNRQGVAQAIAASKQRIDALQGEANGLSNVITGYQRQIAEEKRLAPIREEELRKSTELARAEAARIEALGKANKERQDFIDTLIRIDSLIANNALSESAGIAEKIKLREAEIERIKSAAIAGTVAAADAAKQIKDQETVLATYYARRDELSKTSKDAEITATGELKVANQQYFDFRSENETAWTNLSLMEVDRLSAAHKQAYIDMSGDVQFLGENVAAMAGVASADLEELLGNVADLTANLLISSEDATAQTVGLVVKYAKAAYDELSGFFASVEEKEKALADGLADTKSKILQQQITNEKLALDEKIKGIEKETLSEEEREKKISDAKKSSAKAIAEMERDLAIAKKNIAIKEAEIAMKKALSDMPFWSTKSEKAEVKGVYQELIDAIAATPIPSVPAFARGTDFAPGGVALVGERGPELMNVPRGSQIVPNYKTMQGGGNGVTVNIYSPTAINPSEASAIMKQTARELAFTGVL